MVAGVGAARYAAFISYSHKDAAAARRLHQRLESYRIPRRLAGSAGAHGPVPARLTPIFRDRDELPAAGDLSGTVRAALAASEHLVVLCSPDAAASPWVAREIRAFRELHPDRPVLAAIVAGDPAECFPDALRDAGGVAIEPLAADLRREGDGRRLGFLKLVAGLAGVGLDALVQRDSARQVRRVTAVTLIAVAAMLAMAVLTLFALQARREAERQRAEAEGLVEFMLTDLRDRLKGVGRLDVLTAVNRRALDHYSRQDLRRLSDEQLERRARILHAMGEDDLDQELPDRAIAQFREARRTTAALLAADPDNPDRIFAHSQSEFWVANHDFEAGRRDAARRGFEAYRRLALRLVALQPGNRAYRKEAAYAEGNLCSLALERPRDIPSALQRCRAALEQMYRATQGSNDPADFRARANRHGWLADAYQASGQLENALRQRERQRVIAEHLLAADPRNAQLRASRIWAVRGVAMVERSMGRTGPAREKLTFVVAELTRLVQLDPGNADWREQLRKIQQTLNELTP